MFNGVSFVRIFSFGSIKLSRLDLSHNGMSLIADGAFDALHDSLNELDIGYHHFREFSPGVFLEFRLLQYLSLAHNNLGQAFRAGREKLGNLFDSLQLVQVKSSQQ
jgi:Leucine rich repeat